MKLFAEYVFPETLKENRKLVKAEELVDKVFDIDYIYFTRSNGYLRMYVCITTVEGEKLYFITSSEVLMKQLLENCAFKINRQVCLKKHDKKNYYYFV